MKTTPEQNKKTTRRFVEAFNEHDREAFLTCCAEHSVLHASRGTQRTLDLDTHWQDCLNFYQLFPDIYATIENMVAEGDRVFLRQTLSGTHEGKTEGGRFEPTGKKATWAYWCEYRFENGLIVEMWCLIDALYQLEQFGLVELPTRRQDEEPAEEPRSKDVIRIRSSPPTT